MKKNVYKRNIKQSKESKTKHERMKKKGKG